MKIARIVPQTRLPRGVDFFDYSVPPGLELRIGSVVKIPLRNQTSLGVVFDIVDEAPKFTLKEIIGVQGVLPASLIEIIKHAAEELFISPSSFIHTVIGFPPKKLMPGRKVKPPLNIAPLTLKAPRVPLVVEAFKKISGSTNHILCRYQFESEKNALIFKLIEEATKTGKKTILICPTVAQALEWQSTLKISTSLIHGQQNLTEQWQNWEALATGRSNVAIGTRQAIFAPLNKADLIILDQAESDDLKQSDQNPRYDSRDLSLNRAQIDQARLCFFSQTPRIQDFHSSHFEHVEIPYATQESQALIASLKDSQKEQSYYLTKQLYDQIEETLSRGQKTFLLVNKKGVSPALVCQDCQKEFSCPNCQLALSVTSSALHCARCQHRQPIPIICSKCKSTRLKAVGIGINKLEDILKKAWPQILIDHVDSDKPEYNQQAQIILGTPIFISRYLDKITTLGLIGIISIDNLLNLPEINAEEKAFRLITRLACFAQGKGIPFILQSQNTENTVLHQAVNGEYSKFYEKTIIDRQKLGYPPFKKLIKLTCKCPIKDEAIKQAEEIKLKLNGVQALENIQGPQTPEKQGSNFCVSLIIKTSEANLYKLAPFFRQLSNNVIIDTDPILLL